MNKVVVKNPRSVLTSVIVKNTLCYEKIIVGGMHPRDRAILISAIENDIKTYYIPHSITKRYEIIPPSETTMFVPGKFGIKHLQSMYTSNNLPILSPLGRPYLSDPIYCDNNKNNVTKRNTQVGDNISVMIITQPIKGGVREQFVQDIIESIRETNIQVSISIKVHPAESKSRYRNLVQDLQAKKIVTIHDEKLNKLLTESDLVITMNSNVGMEAMLIGTPCVIYNTQSPFREIPVYAVQDLVPVLRRPEKLRDFLMNLDPKRLNKMGKKQNEFFCDKIRTSGAISEDIAKSISNE
jgi:hypothetical protein